MLNSHWIGLIAALGAAAGCGGGGLWPGIIEVRDVDRAGGSPEVTKVRDLGNLSEVPAKGALKGIESDGVFVVGEHILVEGDDFGKLPTILVGGRPASVLARTDGGGILTRVPDGVPVGKVPVEVSHPGGKSARDVEVKRYGLIAQPEAGKVWVVDLAPRDANVLPEALSVENPRYVRYSSDGSVAYVASGAAHGAEGAPGVRGKLAVIGMGAAGGPKVVHEVPLDSRIVVALAAAERAPVLAVVGETSLQLLTLAETRHPAPYGLVTLPDDVARGGVITADLDPAGKILALLVADGNRVALFDVSDPSEPTFAGEVSLLPDQRVPLVRDMRFSVDGQTLWVVSGDNALSVSAGKQATRLTMVKITRPEGGGKPTAEVAETSTVSGATAPLRLTIARGQPLASGTTVRTPPDKAAVFLSTIDARLFQLATLDYSKPEGRQRAVQVLSPVVQPGMMVRTDATGGGGPLFTTKYVLSSVDLSPDSQVMLATGCAIETEGGPDRLAFSFGVAVTPLWGNISPRFVKLADMQPDAFKPPFSVGHVRIQP